jgi:2-methylcitrate dehydratase PrpD
MAGGSEAPPLGAILAEFVAGHPRRGWDDAVESAAQRSFMNWLGCAIGAARHPALDATLAALRMLDPAPQGSVPGRNDRVDMASAALLTGMASRALDFDDLHPRTTIHAAGPVAAAVLAVGEHLGSSGRELLDALVLGVDVACRIGSTMGPEHAERGWDITGSTGMLGAAAGCARMLALDAAQTAMALDIAASQPTGLREQAGTMTEPFHVGSAARAGMMSALLAKHDFTASPRALEGPHGFVPVVSERRGWQEATEALGRRFEIAANLLKPFACAVALHPAIDAAVQLRARGVVAAQVQQLQLDVHPAALALEGDAHPRHAAAARASLAHAAAVGLLFGRAGPAEFDDAAVHRPDVAALREAVRATADPALADTAARATAVLADGRREAVHVAHAIGSAARPLDDDALRAKFASLVEPVLGPSRCALLSDACVRLASMEDLRELASLCRPSSSR